MYTDTDRLNFLIKYAAKIQDLGNWCILRDEGGVILGEDVTPRAAIDNAMDERDR